MYLGKKCGTVVLKNIFALKYNPQHILPHNSLNGSTTSNNNKVLWREFLRF